MASLQALLLSPAPWVLPNKNAAILLPGATTAFTLFSAKNTYGINKKSKEKR
ncbi:hypothetical protein SAMN05660909_01095 [Chitinophaga terrae (ex Kim and Jung 2007)]|uniref:Uncharacterized protein n=1 Tax=Chitinophaga terrae (ex Kim and Jung 2007) TaxID=408074 RepID=A0A1H3Z879_9BACT|nr:hypothetical protein [Chitinophaga terrae (ex Kim and Jung 2007)]SEA19959.1 hypothetical protein SAMN05660909_01095 [Chitinophaga terrae (ex Kim and Jung 2007)]